MSGRRVAFLTPEFSAKEAKGGGLGNYLGRIARALKQAGHDPEIFVASDVEPQVSWHEGIRVEFVSPHRNVPIRLFSLLCLKLFRARSLEPVLYGASIALGLARALAKRQADAPFDLVQSAGNYGSGFFVPRVAGRIHLQRLSSNTALYSKIDGRCTLGAWLRDLLERHAAKRADKVYAPSRFLAEYCSERWGVEVAVIRPPAFIETLDADLADLDLPDRFLLHFGQIGPRKGSDTLAKALVSVWQREPDVKFVWAGKVVNEGDFERCHHLWGENATNVIWLGPVSKPRIYALLDKAVASVLPSAVDNLPNTVIESLLCGVPVIGTSGASIDELVEQDINGRLVETGDHAALAENIIQVWRNEVPWTRGALVAPEAFEELEPTVAARNLLAFSGVGAS